MVLPFKHLRHQLPVIASLGRTALSTLRKPGAGTGAVTGVEIVKTIAPRPAELVRDDLRHVGGDPAAYRGVVPPHLFPQWGFPLAARTLEGVPYPLARVLNGGCRLEINAPLPADAALTVRAQLVDIDDDGRRAVLQQRVTTGTAAAPDALVATLFAIVPLKKEPGARGPRQVVRVPDDARELARWRLGRDAGLAFAMLTGDVNPVHWIAPYARAAGFKSTILHGFATMARAIEGLVRARFAGDPSRLRVWDCKFTRPLLLPAQVGLYTRGQDVWVADAPGGPAYLSAHFEAA
jgi:acyl dehydratase